MNINIRNTTGMNQVHNQRVGQAQQRNNERLATGRRINRAADDAAGLAVSEGILNQIRGLDQALQNTRDGANLLRTADGAMNEMGEMLGRARELTVQVANGTMSQTARNAIYAEVSQIMDEINQVAARTEFNGQNLLDNPDGVELQVGANAGQRVEAAVGAVNLDTMGLTGFSDMFQSAASSGVGVGGAALSAMISRIDEAADFLASARAEMGAMENRLGHTGNNLSTASVNANRSNSQIRDADMARESMERARNQVLQRANQNMQAQSNQMHSRMAQRLLG